MGMLYFFARHEIPPSSPNSPCSALNITLGLNYLRVSPDHGVGYDIAGKNIAKENSVKSAVLLGVELYEKRKIYFDCNRKIQTTY